MFTRGFLEEIRLKAIRRRVLFRALDGVDRGILYLCTRVVDEVSSPVLGVQLVEIVSRLRDAMKSAFTRHIECCGFKRVIELVEQARAWGCEAAVRPSAGFAAGFCSGFFFRLSSMNRAAADKLSYYIA